MAKSARQGLPGDRLGTALRQPECLDRLADLGRQARSVEPEDAPQVGDGSVVDELVARDADDPDRGLAERRISGASLLDELQDPAPEATDRDAFLERDDQLLATGLVEDELAVERSSVPRVDDPDRPAVVLELCGGLERPHHDRPEADEQQVAALAKDLAATDRDDRRRDGLQAEPGIARVVQGERVVLAQRGVEQRAQLLLIPGEAITRFGSWRWAGSVNIPW